MKTNVEVEAELLNEAMRLQKDKTKKQLVNDALDAYVRHLKRKSMLDLFGKVKWEGNLDEMRAS